jgi:hypothetical protein
MITVQLTCSCPERKDRPFPFVHPLYTAYPILSAKIGLLQLQQFCPTSFFDPGIPPAHGICIIARTPVATPCMFIFVVIMHAPSQVSIRSLFPAEKRSGNELQGLNILVRDTHEDAVLDRALIVPRGRGE